MSPSVEPSTEEVCVHFVDTFARGLDETSKLSADGRAMVEARCVADLDTARQSVDPVEHRRRVQCVMAADDFMDMIGCQPFELAGADAEPSPPPPPPSGEHSMQPLSKLMNIAISVPNPDPAALQQTKAARFDKADGTTVVAFCVDVTGETSDIHTAQKFPGDPMIDQILRDTVATWRFEPFTVDGKAIKACSEKTFKLKFK
ncbi:energy transducer TonB [Enhygromyxa salina]|uniref:Gram-negative bacterial tonB protein n=1 Tax=Enhygromyxa salina TaxID=215803 RepID=A0A2S9YML5_9BACT|nr:hypothetical protein [Enhygromyxa salina]PRQ06328.1 Gram-negative bacterial tonB protein [Enhygromyxa salina]